MGQAVLTLGAMEEALAELRDLEWRAPSGGRSLAVSPWAKDGPWHLAQATGDDVAAGNVEYSETLLTIAAGKELLVRKVDSLRPRTPLRSVEVARLEELRGWLELLEDGLDRAIVWEASFHLSRGEPKDWPRIKRRVAYPYSRQRLARRYREALAKLVCRVNGVPVRHFRAVLAREGCAFVDLLPR
ncbi:hypothetical protein ACLBKU_11960 [Erythrobacter sp. NE805]|uniref:hypothetical protein n=1 Tax=Erythrobacter sp. NE805 TaxID=3389875 RepID=UPI00396B1FCE